MSQNNERNPFTVLIPIGAVGAGLTVNVAGIKLPRNAEILSASLVDTVAVAASGSAYVTVSLKDHTNSALVLATGDTKLGLAAFEGLDLALQATPNDAYEGSAVAGIGATAQTLADKGDTLEVTAVSTSTAVLTNAVLSVMLHYK